MSTTSGPEPWTWTLIRSLEKAGAGDRYGDIFVDTGKAHAVYKEWLAMTRPAPGPDGLRRPLWFDRPLRPVVEAYKFHAVSSEGQSRQAQRPDNVTEGTGK